MISFYYVCTYVEYLIYCLNLYYESLHKQKVLSNKVEFMHTYRITRHYKEKRMLKSKANIYTNFFMALQFCLTGIQIVICTHTYSGTSLLWTPLGQHEVS